jgi:hypothetical protein
MFRLQAPINQFPDMRGNFMNYMNAIEASEELNIIHLENALLCANCEMIISETRNGKCPVCGSGAQLSLSRLLGGTLEHPCQPASPPKLQILNGRMEAQAS